MEWVLTIVLSLHLQAYDQVNTQGGVSMTMMQYQFSSEARCNAEGQRLTKKFALGHSLLTSKAAVVAKATYDCMKSN